MVLALVVGIRAPLGTLSVIFCMMYGKCLVCENNIISYMYNIHAVKYTHTFCNTQVLTMAKTKKSFLSIPFVMYICFQCSFVRNKCYCSVANKICGTCYFWLLISVVRH